MFRNPIIYNLGDIIHILIDAMKHGIIDRRTYEKLKKFIYNNYPWYEEEREETTD